MSIPAGAVLKQESEGVRWYTLACVGHNEIHYVQLQECVLSGSWCGPRAIFHAICSMKPDAAQALYEALKCDNHDKAMGIVKQRLYEVQEEQVALYHLERLEARMK